MVFGLELFPAAQWDSFAELLAAQWDSASAAWSFRESGPALAAWSGRPVRASAAAAASTAVFVPVLHSFRRTEQSTEPLP
jgi:hypothetical protein